MSMVSVPYLETDNFITRLSVLIWGVVSLLFELLAGAGLPLGDWVDGLQVGGVGQHGHMEGVGSTEVQIYRGGEVGEDIPDGGRVCWELTEATHLTEHQLEVEGQRRQELLEAVCEPLPFLQAGQLTGLYGNAATVGPLQQNLLTSIECSDIRDWVTVQLRVPLALFGSVTVDSFLGPAWINSETKTFLTDVLSADPSHILQHVDEQKLVTLHEYRNLHIFSKSAPDDSIIRLLDTLISKNGGPRGNTSKQFYSKRLGRWTFSFWNQSNENVFQEPRREVKLKGISFEKLGVNKYKEGIKFTNKSKLTFMKGKKTTDGTHC
ncbi:unnamed protein product [Coregonus sp. 'balchen']|nr:unnamed protein product [Coregonus sp. 'balchen']